MSEHTKIEWADASWSPLLGCDRVSSGCASCYAVRTAWRLQHNPNAKVKAAYEGLVERQPNGQLDWTGRVNLLPDRLMQPLRWKGAIRIFVNSQSDLFHEDVPDEFIAAVFGVMAMAPQHTFQILTKRPDRMRDWMARETDRCWGAAYPTLGWCIWQAHLLSGERFDLIREVEMAPEWPLPNVWLGTSVENQKTADERIPSLIQTPAAVRWVSAEPLIGRLSLFDVSEGVLRGVGVVPAGGRSNGPSEPDDWVDDSYPGLDWVVVGGESGPNARPMHPDWARQLRDECQAANVPYFFKQAGEWGPVGDCDEHGMRSWSSSNPAHKPPGKPIRLLSEREDGLISNTQVMARVGKHTAGRLLDGVLHDAYPVNGVVVASGNEAEREGAADA